jgi:hypothetical protein
MLIVIPTAFIRIRKLVARLGRLQSCAFELLRVSQHISFTLYLYAISSWIIDRVCDSIAELISLRRA